MTKDRAAAIAEILDELEQLEIPLNPYFDDAEPAAVIDSVLSGKIDSLRAYCRSLGWNELSAEMERITPLRGNAVQALERRTV